MFRLSLGRSRHAAVALLRRFATDLPEHKRVTMPKVSPTMTHGRLIEWKKGEGDPISEGDTLAEVETDKATMPIEAKDEGFLARILVKNDTADIPLGQLLAITVEEEESISAFVNYEPPSNEGKEQRNGTKDKPAPGITSESKPTKISLPKAERSHQQAKSNAKPYHGPVGPAVARLQNEFPQINLDNVKGTGPGDRILKGDLLAAIVDGSAFGRQGIDSALTAPSSPSKSFPQEDETEKRAFTDVPLTSMRRAIARRLAESKRGIPHRYATVSYELDAVLSLRKKLNSADPSLSLSVNDFIIQAVAISLRRVPEMNVQYDSASEMSQWNDSIDVAFAVAIENGLITPIVKNADSRGLQGIASETKRLVSLARSGSLQPDDYEGGSFSISNLGMYGVTSFSAIINPPQSGILAVGGGIPRVLSDSENGGFRHAVVGTGTLSTDARAVGEETAAKFLSEFSSCLTKPDTMLL